MSIPVKKYKKLAVSSTINELLELHRDELKGLITSSFNSYKAELGEMLRPLQGRISPSVTAEDILSLSSIKLSYKEKTFLNYIKQNPNKSKQDIVNDFKSSYSRVTVFKILDSLSNHEMILVSQDPENRQTHKIVFNEKSLLLGLMQETARLKQAFFNVVNRLQDIVKRNPDNEIFNKSILTFLGNLVRFYRDVIDQYMMKMLFDWSRRTANKNVLTRAYNISFSTLSSILSELGSLYQKCADKSMPFESMYAELYEPYTQNYLKLIKNIQSFATDFKIKKEVNDLAESCRVGLSLAEYNRQAYQ